VKNKEDKILLFFVVVLFCVVLQIFLSSVPLFFITNKQHQTFYKERERERERQRQRETDEDDDEDDDVTTKKTKKKKKRENV